ncbi:hypothetical protein [Cryobacterium arcticum]|uniref:DUF4352 domain-containing protein n=1 Tax=Cryobacterium arcticum TaxID=670052 RepID=A0A1B1BNB4_9MICO|nr:hypothetical protein [Cryobacterium arcticum]ANP74110.1 hypothetical protein PA27867_3180 [Cryobacterium arcticum]
MPRSDTPSGEARVRRWGAGGGVVLLVGVAVVLFAASLQIAGPAGSPPAGATGETARLTSVEGGLSAVPVTAPPDAGTLTPAGSETQPLIEPVAVKPLAELPPVSLTAPVAPVPGVVFGIEPLQSVTANVVQDGAAVPALRVSVVLRNDTPDAMNLRSVQVTLSVGAEQLPISGRPDSDGHSFPDSLLPGAATTADFLFAVPVDQRAVVKVCVTYAAGVPAVAFVGSAPR